MDNDRLVANYSFTEGEYITSMTLYSGMGVDGFSFITNVQAYPHIRGTGGTPMPPTTGQRVLFISGEVHEYFVNHMVSKVRVYFDSC